MEDTELRRAVRAMTAMIQNGEWAEHVSKDPDAIALEAAITDLHNDLSIAQDATPPAPAKGEEVAVAWMRIDPFGNAYVTSPDTDGAFAVVRATLKAAPGAEGEQ